MSSANDAPGVEDLPTAVLGAEVSVGAVEVDAHTLTLLTPDGDLVRVLADRDRALVEVDGVARYLVEVGARIVVEPVPGATVTAVRTWLHGTVLALLLAQQERFALHASVVDLGGRRIAVAGRTGAGKSTTVIAAALAGGRLVSDDVAVLDVTEDRIDCVPYGRSVHLALDAAARLAIDVSALPPVASGVDKVTIPAPPPAPGPLDDIVVLLPRDTAAPRLTSLGEVAAMKAVRRHAFRHALLEPLWAEEAFAWQVAVARRVPVHRLVRPSAWSADAVVDALRGLGEVSR